MKTIDSQNAFCEKRERLLNAVEFKPVDRLPVQGWNGTIAALERVTGRRDFRDNPKDVYAQAMKTWDVDVILQFVLPERLDGVCGPGRAVNTRDGLHTVVLGMREQWVQERGPMQSPEDFRDFCLSLPPASQAGHYVDPEATGRRWQELDHWARFLRPIVYIPGHLCGKVLWMWYTAVGYENYLMAHELYPEAVERLFAFTGEEARLRNAAIARTIREHDLVPLIYWGEDICDNSGPMCSPNRLREIYFPHLRRATEPLVEAGIHWMWHSDGNILPILPDLLDCGIDGFQGFEEDKGMDLTALARATCRNGRPPFLCGSVNVTTTMYTTPKTVRSDIDRMVRLAEGRGGGAILSTSSTIMEDTPVENVLAFYDHARHYHDGWPGRRQ